MSWLPDMDLNHDKQIQSLLCYRYTIGQMCGYKVEFSQAESRLETDECGSGLAGFVNPSIHQSINPVTL